MIEGQRQRHGRAPHKVWHGRGDGRADVRAELFGGNRDEHRPVADPETEQQNHEVKRAVRLTGRQEIRAHCHRSEQEKCKEDFPPGLQQLAEIAAGKAAERDAEITEGDALRDLDFTLDVQGFGYLRRERYENADDAPQRQTDEDAAQIFHEAGQIGEQHQEIAA